nr:CheR family methyltransferase [Desulfobacula sp.]
MSDSPTRQKVVIRLCKSLNPGGYFFVGMSENLHGLEHGLSMVTPSGYQKKS